MHKVLIIDDEKDICFLISEILKDENYNTSIALNSDEAISKFNEIKPDLVILDVWLSNSKLDGIEILKEFKSININIPIIIISGHGTVDLAVKSIKNGAYDFLEKPFNSDKLIILTKRAIESSSLLSENKNLKDTLIKNSIEAVEKIPNPAVEVLIATDARNIKIEIKDNGVGIDEKMVSKIFEPYFTTKTKGTGLGLSIVKRIIEDHGGKIKIEKNKNMAGTTSLINFEYNA